RGPGDADRAGSAAAAGGRGTGSGGGLMSDVNGDMGYIEPRLLVAGDAERLSPFVREYFAPVPVVTVPDYLTAVAELPRSPTQGVVLGVDPECRRAESAIGAV